MARHMISPLVVASYVGVEQKTVRLWMNQGLFESSDEGLRRYLHAHLPSWISADDWIEECTLSEEPLMGIQEVQVFLPWSARAICSVLHNQKGLYIMRRNGVGFTPMVLPQWVYEQLHWDKPLGSPQGLARLFCVSVSTVHFWRASGYISCIVPGHEHEPDDAYLWPLCWLAYLRAYASPELRPMLSTLLHRALSGQSPELVSIGGLANHLGRSRKVVLDWACSGKILSLRTPGGHFRVSPAWVR